MKIHGQSYFIIIFPFRHLVIHSRFTNYRAYAILKTKAAKLKSELKNLKSNFLVLSRDRRNPEFQLGHGVTKEYFLGGIQ